MIATIIGKPNSGKSKQAERLVMDLAGEGDRYYLATMIPYGEEGEKRVWRHRQMREGKGFVTIEKPFDIGSVMEKIPEHEEKTVLLECASNLVANELFERKKEIRPTTGTDEKEHLEAVCRKIEHDLRRLAASVKNLIIVSNTFEDEEVTEDADAQLYLEATNRINAMLRRFSDTVIE